LPGGPGTEAARPLISTGGRYGLMNLFWKGFDKLLDLMAALAGVILVFICAAVCYTIGMRFLFNMTTIWITQTTEYALLWIVFLATTWLLREGGHITTDIIYASLNDKTKRYLDCIMFIIGGITCAVCAYYGIVYTWESIVNGVTDVRAVTVPKSAVFVITPLGFLLLTIQFSRMAWGKFADIRGGR
jgi:C4-dicarboxylate transporter, DctQ subunit